MHGQKRGNTDIQPEEADDGGIDKVVKLKKDKEKKKKKVVIGDEGKNCRSERTTMFL